MAVAARCSHGQCGASQRALADRSSISMTSPALMASAAAITASVRQRRLWKVSIRTPGENVVSYRYLSPGEAPAAHCSNAVTIMGRGIPDDDMSPRPRSLPHPNPLPEGEGANVLRESHANARISQQATRQNRRRGACSAQQRRNTVYFTIAYLLVTTAVSAGGTINGRHWKGTTSCHAARYRTFLSAIRTDP